MWTVKEQNDLQERILGERLSDLMPRLMRECGVEMWVVLSREYDEDPLFKTLVPPLVKNAGRTSSPQPGQRCRWARYSVTLNGFSKSSACWRNLQSASSSESRSPSASNAATRSQRSSKLTESVPMIAIARAAAQVGSEIP